MIPDPTDRLLERAASDLGAIVDNMIVYLEDRLAEGEDNLTPHLHVRAVADYESDPEDTLFVLATDFSEWDDKRTALRALGISFYEKKRVPVAACLSSEAWQSEQPASAPHIEPRHDPNRKEVILIMGLTVDLKRCMYATIPFERDAQGMMHKSGEIVRVDGARSPLLEEFFLGFRDKFMASVAQKN